MFYTICWSDDYMHCRFSIFIQGWNHHLLSRVLGWNCCSGFGLFRFGLRTRSMSNVCLVKRIITKPELDRVSSIFFFFFFFCICEFVSSFCDLWICLDKRNRKCKKMFDRNSLTLFLKRQKISKKTFLDLFVVFFKKN